MLAPPRPSADQGARTPPTSGTLARAGRAAALIGAVAALGVACGDDANRQGADAAAETPTGRRLTAEFLADADSMVSDETEARCVSGRLVAALGEDRLVEAGVTARDVGDFTDYDFTDREIDTFVDALFDCVDLATLFVDDFGAERAACLADALDEDVVKRLMRRQFAAGSDPTEESSDALRDVAERCDLAAAA